MQGSYFLPKEKVERLAKDVGMNNQEGIYLYGVCDPRVKKLLPAPLELADASLPLFYLYAVAIREPTFAPWYMEGGIGVLARYNKTVGIYFFNVQLSGPGALMGAYVGRETSGLPKKICERIVVERTDEQAHCLIERNGTILVEVELEIGQYNVPEYHSPAEECNGKEGGLLMEDGGCLLHTYKLESSTAKNMELLFYNSPTRYYSWEPATATVTLGSTIDDPWGEIPLISVLGAAWAKTDNWIKGLSVLYRYPQDEAMEAMRSLFTGRYDRSMLCEKHQHHE